MQYALKYAYDGSLFEGSQRYRRKKGTVDGEILNVLYRMKAIPEDETPSLYFQTASRTDKGVHALGAVCSIKTDFREKELLRALNGNLDGIVFWGISHVKEGFKPRWALSRTYVYLLPSIMLGTRYEDAVKAAEIFQGIHDFTLLSRPEASKRTNPVREIFSSSLEKEGDWWVFRVVGRAFLWNQVRKMIRAIQMISYGEMSLNDLKAILKGREVGEKVMKKKKISISLLPATGLILYDVHYENVLFDIDKEALKVAEKRILRKIQYHKSQDLIHQMLLTLSCANHFGKDNLQM